MLNNFQKKIVFSLSRRGFFNWFPDKWYISLMYYARLDKKLNLNKPCTFNEKLQWLKLNERNIAYAKFVDKYEAKELVGNIIGKEHIIPTIGIWNKFDDINFEQLPNEFVIKCTHDSGGIIICKDKDSFNIQEAKKKINKCLKKNYYWHCREWPYKSVTPRIIVENYIKVSNNNELNDYKFFCFNGKVKFFKIDFDRFIQHKANYYDTKGNLLPFYEEICPSNPDKKLEMPENLNEMIKLAELIAKNHLFLRVDFYDVNNIIYFGEITFYPASGFGKILPEEWDFKIGKLLDLEI